MITLTRQGYPLHGNRFPVVVDHDGFPLFKGYLIDIVGQAPVRSEEHTSELQSRPQLVCRLLLEKKKPCAQRSQCPRPPCSSAGAPQDDGRRVRSDTSTSSMTGTASSCSPRAMHRGRAAACRVRG